jgi:dTDP-4-amino-4,6-dideoxygalactose transaminase
LRLDELQAAFLRVKLKKLDEWNKRRKELASTYLKELSDVPIFSLPFVPDWVEPVWHLFVIRDPRRDFVQQKLAEAEVGTLIRYPVPTHLSGAYASEEWSRGPFRSAKS